MQSWSLALSQRAIHFKGDLVSILIYVFFLIQNVGYSFLQGSPSYPSKD